MVVHTRDTSDGFQSAAATAELQDGASSAPYIVFAGGGTGGHLYPALAIAEALRKRLPSSRFVFFGTQRPIDERVLTQAESDPTGPRLPLIPQTLPPFRRAPWQWPSFYRGFRQSTLTCRVRFASDRPDMVVGTGGIGSVPAVREAARVGIPTALLNPDALPGRANRYLASSADVVFAQWEETVGQFPRRTRVIVCGCPVRSAFNMVSREAGLRRFGLDGNRRTLLVTGASQGAHSVNEAVLANLDLLESTCDWQVLHLTGEGDYEEVMEAYRHRAGSAANAPIRAVVLAYTDHMAEALAAADLVVARAGASTLAEISAVGRASILMPYPHHKDMHQLANARCLVRASAARIVHDKGNREVNGPALREVLEQLMYDDGAREAMASAARRLGRGQAAAEIAETIMGMLNGSAARSLHDRPGKPAFPVESCSHVL